MGILVETAIAHAEHELGKKFPKEITPMHVVNMAGSALVNMRAWGWLVRPTAALDLIAGSDSIALPDDFGSLLALYAMDETVSHARWCAMSELAWRRSAQTQYDDALIRYIALSYDSNTGEHLSAPVARFEVFSTPNASVTGALRLLYRAGWVPCSDSSDELPIHPSCDLLFIELIRAVAQGLVASNRGGVSRRMDEIKKGFSFTDAAGADLRTTQSTPVFIAKNARAIWPVPKLVN
jgi:hypothetical protein